MWTEVDVVSVGLRPSSPEESSLLDFPIPTMSEKKTLLARKPDRISPSVWMFVRGATQLTENGNKNPTCSSNKVVEPRIGKSCWFCRFSGFYWFSRLYPFSGFYRVGKKSIPWFS